MNKKFFPSEVSYIIGLVLIALGVVFANAANFGMSMIVAPAYVIYRTLNPIFSFFTFGMSEYCVQALLIVLMIIILRRFRLSFLFSFITAVIYGFILDGLLLLGPYIPSTFMWQRVICFCIATLLSCSGVAMMFHTYLAPESYELIVKEVSNQFRFNISKFKTFYDICSFAAAIILSFVFFGFGNFVGIGWGTVISAFTNGFIISRFSKLYEKKLVFKDKLNFRTFFTGEEPIK